MAEVALHAVRKIYPGGVEAVRDITLTVPDKALCVLVGPSGCGKSTLLRIVAGLEEVTEGEIAIDGRRVNEVEPADRDIAMVFQNYALYPHMSVFDNMAYGLRNRGTPRAEIEARVAAAAKTLDIEMLLKRRPRELSGGQRQRVAMGRAIVRQPKVFLFDEPLSNLDAKLRVAMRVEIKRLQRALGVTAIYVTHDQLEAMTLADVLVVMNAGRIEQIGPALELYERPQTVFVASFIGAPPMNLIDLDETPVKALLGAAAPATAGALLGVRPEDLRAADGGPPEGGLAATLAVTAVEPVGAETFCYGHLDGSRAELIVRLGGKSVPAPGERLSVVADRAQLHLFDKASGQRRAF